MYVCLHIYECICIYVICRVGLGTILICNQFLLIFIICFEIILHKLIMISTHFLSDYKDFLHIQFKITQHIILVKQKSLCNSENIGQFHKP